VPPAEVRVTADSPHGSRLHRSGTAHGLVANRCGGPRHPSIGSTSVRACDSRLPDDLHWPEPADVMHLRRRNERTGRLKKMVADRDLERGAGEDRGGPEKAVGRSSEEEALVNRESTSRSRRTCLIHDRISPCNSGTAIALPDRHLDTEGRGGRWRTPGRGLSGDYQGFAIDDWCFAEDGAQRMASRSVAQTPTSCVRSAESAWRS
jgi:hypothetical protein